MEDHEHDDLLQVFADYVRDRPAALADLLDLLDDTVVDQGAPMVSLGIKYSKLLKLSRDLKRQRSKLVCEWQEEPEYEQDAGSGNPDSDNFLGMRQIFSGTPECRFDYHPQTERHNRPVEDWCPSCRESQRLSDEIREAGHRRAALLRRIVKASKEAT